jgi:hypothetical protein
VASIQYLGVVNHSKLNKLSGTSILRRADRPADSVDSAGIEPIEQVGQIHQRSGVALLFENSAPGSKPASQAWIIGSESSQSSS